MNYTYLTPRGFDYRVKFPIVNITHSDQRAISDWCDENMGWSNWTYNDGHMCFRNERDQMCFLLRWR